MTDYLETDRSRQPGAASPPDDRFQAVHTDPARCGGVRGGGGETGRNFRSCSSHGSTGGASVWFRSNVLNICRDARIRVVGKSQSCMVERFEADLSPTQLQAW